MEDLINDIKKIHLELLLSVLLEVKDIHEILKTLYDNNNNVEVIIDFFNLMIFFKNCRMSNDQITVEGVYLKTKNFFSKTQ